MSQGKKTECKFCHELYSKNKTDMCDNCYNEYIRRRDLLDELSVKKNKEHAKKIYEEHLKTMGDNPDKAWYEKKRLLRSNILKYESNKNFLD